LQKISLHTLCISRDKGSFIVFIECREGILGFMLFKTYHKKLKEWSPCPYIHIHRREKTQVGHGLVYKSLYTDM
jgi:hypothetical protein